jgi:hypothetical protein
MAFLSLLDHTLAEVANGVGGQGVEAAVVG